ncbi:MAG: acetyl-CoA carboxylase, carboxyltransferase subunit beta [Flavobacteriales bacterium]
MSWFKRKIQGITTKNKEKKEIPEGLWYKCPECKNVLTSEEHADHNWVCDKCRYHDKIGSLQYFSILFDENEYEEIAPNLTSGDPLQFTDVKSYKDKVKSTIAKTGLKDAIRVAKGTLDGQDVVIACMDFSFFGGSMGSVVGEKIARGIDHAIQSKCAFICISKSGGARMQEAGLSLMQMAKTSAKLTQLAEARLPYVSILTNPTTGGVTASFAMLGDINIAEPKATIGFAGKRLVQDTMKKELPEGFQTAEFVLEHGFLDYIVDRKNLKSKLSQSLKWFAA